MSTNPLSTTNITWQGKASAVYRQTIYYEDFAATNPCKILNAETLRKIPQGEGYLAREKAKDD
jgi:hypothetical protein